MTANKKRAVLVGLSMLLTFIALRAYLFLSPGTNLDIGGYNIHHLFTGLILLTIGGIPLVLIQGDSLRLNIATIVFGSGLGMALDEWVYLLTTDGSDASYLLPISFWGGITMIGLVLAYIVFLLLCANRCRHIDSENRGDAV